MVPQAPDACDQYRRDMFFRYNQTFQYFLGQSSLVEVEFGE